MHSGATSVAPRQRPRGTVVGGSGRSGTLPSLPAPALIGASLPTSRAAQTSTTNNDDGYPVAAPSRPIDNYQPRAQAQVSTNPFAQSTASGGSNSVQLQHSSENISSNPFMASSQTRKF